MKPYPAYKSSGVEWLGQVPEGWATTQLKRFATMTYGDALASETRDDDGGIPVYGSNGPVGWHSIGNVLAPAILIGRKGSFGALNWSDRACFAIDTVYFVDCRSASCNLRWLYWAMHNANFDALSQDTGVPGLSRASAHDTWFPLPPLPEQQAIAAFLDRETAKIDGLIEEQRRLIALLAEKRQATISHAVARGLNPDARLKPSGVEWLGDIPEGWEVVRIKMLATLITKGTTPTTLGFDFEESGVRFLKAENISSDGLVSTDPEFFISEEANNALIRSQLQANDILVVIAGATTGKSATLRVEFLPANTNQAVAFIRCRDKQYSRWIQRWLSTPFVQNLISLGSVQSAQPNLSMEDLGNIPILVPASDQLPEILDTCDRVILQIDTLTETATSAITLLQERRAALISAAVTGKIDVRDLASAQAA